eukprot:Skav202241  [mRNA]  locus=scaffold1417:120561:123754:+ [translate_table: standard]
MGAPGENGGDDAIWAMDTDLAADEVRVPAAEPLVEVVQPLRSAALHHFLSWEDMLIVAQAEDLAKRGHHGLAGFLSPRELGDPAARRHVAAEESCLRCTGPGGGVKGPGHMVTEGG